MSRWEEATLTKKVPKLSQKNQKCLKVHKPSVKLRTVHFKGKHKLLEKSVRGVPTFAKAHFGRPSPSSRQKLNGTD
ncbi:hypothetical protein BMR02_02350 [Methylococcaceae bacterium HT1]|nr:hypothetical protein BMR02_02350 [Methylococcaceae bacterium HT1]